jgi:hypothetical protein
MARRQTSRSEIEKPPYGLTKKQWREVQKEALKIDPKTAITSVHTAYFYDPYGIHPNLPDEYKTTVKYDMARSPNSDVWVCFEDLPWKTVRALRKRDKKSSRERTEEKFYELD